MTATMNMPMSVLTGGNPHQACIDACIKCAQICEECFSMCLNEPDVKARQKCIMTLQDCAEICSTAACYMSRQSINAKELCNVCATICQKCATDCEMFRDQHCQDCAQTCRQCAEECIAMINM